MTAIGFFAFAVGSLMGMLDRPLFGTKETPGWYALLGLSLLLGGLVCLIAAISYVLWVRMP